MIEQCKAAGRVVRCSRRATRDGYCGQHHPEAVAARRAKRDAKWAAKEAADAMAQWNARQDRDRNIVRDFLAWARANVNVPMQDVDTIKDAVDRWPGTSA